MIWQAHCQQVCQKRCRIAAIHGDGLRGEADVDGTHKKPPRGERTPRLPFIEGHVHEGSLVAHFFDQTIKTTSTHQP